MADPAPELDVTHVRQARRGRHALMVLAWSLGLGLVVLAVVFLGWRGSLAPLRGNREAPPEVAQAARAEPGVVGQSATAAAPQAVAGQAARQPQAGG
jgi:hypothetical protein